MNEKVTDRLGQLAKGSAFLFLGNVLGLGATFATRVIAARHLGPTDYGLVVLGVTVLNLLMLLSLFGLHQGVARQLPQDESPSEVFFGASLIAIPVSIGVSILAFQLTDTVVGILAGPSFIPIYQLFVFVLPLLVFARLVVGIARGSENTLGRVLIWNICKQGLVALAVLVAASLGLGVLSLTLLWVGALSVTGVVAAIFLVTSTNVRTPTLALSGKPRKSIFHQASVLFTFSLPLMLSGTIRLTMQQADNFLVGFFLQSSDVGIYDATYTLGQGLFIITATVGYLFLPIFSDFHASGATDRMDRFYKLTTKWMAFLVLPAYLLMLFYPERILAAVFKTEYAVGAQSLQLVATGFFAHVSMGIAGNSLIATGRTGEVAKGNAVALAINLVLNIILIPQYGITGAAIAAAVAYVVMNSYWLYRLNELADVQPFYREYLIPLVAGALAFVVLKSILGIIFPNSMANTAVFLLVFLIVYPGVIVAFGGVESEEQELLSKYIPHINI